VLLCGRELDNLIPPDTFDTSGEDFSVWGVSQGGGGAGGDVGGDIWTESDYLELDLD